MFDVKSVLWFCVARAEQNLTAAKSRPQIILNGSLVLK